MGYYLDEYVPKSTIPEGSSGVWHIKKFEVTGDQAMLDQMRNGHRWCPPGTYTKLVRDQGWGPMMSDTRAEREDHLEVARKAHGSVLINGLGLGLITAAILLKNEVTDVTVVEIEPDIIKLVEPHIRDPRLTVVCADAYTYDPGKGRRFDVVWHDIWPDICEDNLDDMSRLHRRYGRRAAWQASWCRDECRRLRRRTNSLYRW